jgi:hypothetical protein
MQTRVDGTQLKLLDIIQNNKVITCIKIIILLNTEFLVIGSPQQLSKLSNLSLIFDSATTITPVNSPRNLGIVFDNHLSFNDQVTALSKSCFYHNDS